MPSKTRDVMNALKTAIQAINGTGNYSFILSGDDQVKIGRPTIGDVRLPSCWIAVGTLTSDHGPQLGRYQRNLVVDIEARTTVSMDTVSERGLKAVDLLDELCQAIQASRSLGGLVTDVIVTGTTVDGDEMGIPGVGVVFAQVETYWYANTSAGV